MSASSYLLSRSPEIRVVCAASAQSEWSSWGRPLQQRVCTRGAKVETCMAAGAEAAEHVAAPELPRAGQRELRPQNTWRPGAGLSHAVHAEVNHTQGRVICMSRLLS
jgi:hypothetical protein